MVLGQSQENVFFYKDEEGNTIEDLPQDVAYEVMGHVVILRYDKFFRKHVHVHDLIIRRLT